MNWRGLPQQFVLITLLLGLGFVALRWAVNDIEPSPVNVLRHLLVAAVYAVWHVLRQQWFERMRANEYSGWLTVAAAGRPRFFLQHGLARNTLMLAIVLPGLDWAYSGVLPPAEKVVAEFMLFVVLGLFFAHRDWQRLSYDCQQQRLP